MGNKRHFQIGIDLGGTKIEAVALDKNATGSPIVIRERVATQAQDGYEAVLNNINSIFKKIIHKLPENAIYSVGMGIPGIINPGTQRVINSNTTVLIGKKLGVDLEELLQSRIQIENDANCFALAESISGAGKNYDLVFGIIMGTGCGGGLCINKKVRRGLHGIAGEWGHISIDPKGAECYCGNRGCIESQISGGGVQALHYKQTKNKITMEKIILGWQSGDKECSETMKVFFQNFGRAMSVIINLLDPDAIVLGGGLSNIPELYSLGLKEVSKNAFIESPRTPILQNKLGDSAGVIGAAWIGENNQFLND